MLHVPAARGFVFEKLRTTILSFRGDEAQLSEIHVQRCIPTGFPPERVFGGIVDACRLVHATWTLC